jgi:beta-phosphoglucomutase
MHYSDFEACIFDFDGVIIDSEPLHAEAKRITLDQFKIVYPPQLFVDFKGRSDKDFFNFVADQLAGGVATAQEMDAVKRQAYSQLFEQVPLVDGA